MPLEHITVIPFAPEKEIRSHDTTLMRYFRNMAKTTLAHYFIRDPAHRVLWTPYHPRSDFMSNSFSTVERNPNARIWELGTRKQAPNVLTSIEFIMNHVRGIETLGLIYDYRHCPELAERLLEQLCGGRTTALETPEGGAITIDIPTGSIERFMEERNMTCDS